MKYQEIAMGIAKDLGADYADIRIQRTTQEWIYLEDTSFKQNAQGTIYGYGIRVLKDGAWGFSHSNIFSEEAVKKTTQKAFDIAKFSAKLKKGDGIKLANEKSYIAKYDTPLIKDPFKVPIREKTELMLEISKKMLNYEPIKKTMVYFYSKKEEKIFASTIGTELEINTCFINPMIVAYAFNENDNQSRQFDDGGRATGWEWIESLDFIKKADTIAQEAITKVNADVLGEEKRRTLILDPNHLGLTMHESVGHPTELDRVLGWEADYAGVSFATPEKLKNYQYGSPIVNFVGDNTLKEGLATSGFDDDGVPGQKWFIIKDGILNEYGTTRETAPYIGLDYSRGCNRATFYYDQPMNRIPNLYLLPGKNKYSLSDMIRDTEDGVYIQGRGSFSIDQHRVNFQFGGDYFWEIKNGKLHRPLKKVLYRSNNPEFWNACDAICDERYWKPFGVVNCGKGQPNQTAIMTHGASPSRFRNIRVGGSQ
ncbi:MAG: TldD/PmbA family protein [Candidatus Cloacimonetes bacterium]|nr:TldD/PmbA family protein [Candidatus Cloacimonadota bacterium]